ncbi:MAG: DUF4397 domain-containing protein [Halioglobus sp.]|nr:DUF4397 domain-containing protein [Halioglobus sp.]
MTRLFRMGAAILLLPLVVACSDNDNNNDDDEMMMPEPEPMAAPAELRVTHASNNSPDVNVYVNGERALENVAFKNTSGLIELDAGTYEVEVRGILPDGSETTVIGPVDLSFNEGERTDVFAIGDLANIQANLLDPVAIEEGVSDVRISALHAAFDVGTVDIYVTPPGADLMAFEPITAAFGDSAGPVSLEPDTEYQVRIAPQGSMTPVYTSPATTFSAGTELVLAAVPNTYRVGSSPVTLLGVAAEGSFDVLDEDMGARVLVMHNSFDTPAVDLLVDGSEVEDKLEFGNSAIIEAPAGTYNFVVAADIDNNIAPIDLDLTLEAGWSYAAFAVGSFGDSSVEAILFNDDRRQIATAARLEVIHGSYNVAATLPVDVYLTSDGVIADAEPAIAGLAYKESSGQLQVTPGDYWVTVTVAGDKATVAFDSGGTLALDAETNYKVVARDPSASEVGMPLILVSILED